MGWAWLERRQRSKFPSRKGEEILYEKLGDAATADMFSSFVAQDLQIPWSILYNIYLGIE